MFDRKKSDETAASPWSAEPAPQPKPHHDPPAPASPSFGIGGPAVGGRLFHGLYDGPSDAPVKPDLESHGREPGPSLIAPAADADAGSKSPIDKIGETPVGPTTVEELMQGLVQGLLAGVTSDAEPPPAPRMSDAERKQAEEEYRAKPKK